MTLVYLWSRYQKDCTAREVKPYQYRQFCELYARWCSKNYETLHIQAVIAQKMEVDFAGKTFELIDKLTGEITTIVVFVAVLPYSQYIYAEGMAPPVNPSGLKSTTPAVPYEYMERRTAKVSADFHVRFDNAYYSVDKAYLHKSVMIAASATTVNIYSMKGNLIVSWRRASRRENG